MLESLKVVAWVTGFEAVERLRGALETKAAAVSWG